MAAFRTIPRPSVEQPDCATVTFDLGIGNCKTFSVLDVTATKWYVVACVGDDGDVLIALHLIPKADNWRV